MLYKQAAGAIIVQKRLGLTQYLLLCNSRGEWGFPKGGVEKGETLPETARREVREETGIEKLKFQKGFKEQIQYSYQQNNEKFWKTVDYFLAINENEKIKLSSEHDEYLWLPYQAALDKIVFLNQKEILKKVQRYLGFKLLSTKINL
jgi:tRNA nucleotidyltransferase (CCA-adding enzyme)